MGKFEVFKDVTNQWRFRLLADNNKIIAVSESYKQKQSAIKGIQSVLNNCRNPLIPTMYLD